MTLLYSLLGLRGPGREVNEWVGVNWQAGNEQKAEEEGKKEERK